MQRGPAAWTAHDMAANGDWIMKLTDAHIGELERAARACKQLLAKIDRASFELPTLGPELDAMRRELLQGRGFVLMRGLAVNRYSREELAAMFIGLGAHLGKELVLGPLHDRPEWGIGFEAAIFPPFDERPDAVGTSE